MGDVRAGGGVILGRVGWVTEVILHTILLIGICLGFVFVRKKVILMQNFEISFNVADPYRKPTF